MTDTVLTMGILTLAALVGILVNNSRLSDLRSHVDERFSTLEKLLDARFEAAYQELLRVEGVLDARLSHLERE